MSPPVNALRRSGAARNGRWLVLTAALLLAPGLARAQFNKHTTPAAHTPTPAPSQVTTDATPTVEQPASVSTPTASPSGTAVATATPERAMDQNRAYQDIVPPLDQPTTHESGVGWITVCILVLLNASTLAAGWHYVVQPMRKRLDRQRDGLHKLEDNYADLNRVVVTLRAEINRVASLSKKLGELESSINQLADEIGLHHEPQAHTAVLESADAPVQSAERSPEDVFMAEPVIQPTTPVQREQLGAWFVQEVKNSGGQEATTIWERYFARVQARFGDARWQPLHWDRSVSVPRFQERPSDGFTDTGHCWLVQADAQLFLFFPALTMPAARKKDLPGCQIASSSDALLDLTKLSEFTPPTVTQSTDGWTVRVEGTVVYR